MDNETPKTPLGKKLLAIRNRAIANGMRLKTMEELMTNGKSEESEADLDQEADS